MRAEADVRVMYSRDQQARSEMLHWQQIADKVPGWRVWDRRKAEARAEEARERAVAAGIDWTLVPRPTDGLRAPDRSGRRGSRADAPPPPPRPSGAGQSGLLNGLNLTVHLASAPVAAAQAAERKRAEQRDDTPAPTSETQPTEPSAPEDASSPPASDGDVRPGTPPADVRPRTPDPAPPADAGAAVPPPPAPQPPAPMVGPMPSGPPPTTFASAPVGAAPVATAGGGVALAYGAADTGSLTAVSAMEWLDSEPKPLYEEPTGSCFLQAPDGQLWYQDAAGQYYALGPDGVYYALGQDGYLYGQTPDGGYFTWTQDGTQLQVDEAGQLWAFTDQGQPVLLGDDGRYYSPPDVGDADVPAPEVPELTADPEAGSSVLADWELPAESGYPPEQPLPEPGPTTGETGVVEAIDQTGGLDAGPTPSLGDLAPDPLWSLDEGNRAGEFGVGPPSEPQVLNDQFDDRELLTEREWDVGATAEPPVSFSESLPPSEDAEPQFSDPPPELEDPALEVEDPGLEVEDPGLEVEDPALEVEDPALEFEDPALGVESPPLGFEDPALEVGNPDLEVEAPPPAFEAPALEVEDAPPEVEDPLPPLEDEASPPQFEEPLPTLEDPLPYNEDLGAQDGFTSDDSGVAGGDDLTTLDLPMEPSGEDWTDDTTDV